jgi:DNA replication protein DnaC
MTAVSNLNPAANQPATDTPAPSLSAAQERQSPSPCATRVASMWRPLRTERRTCADHGEYESGLYQYAGQQSWSDCPSCLQQSLREHDKREAEKIKQRQHADLVRAVLGRAAIPPRFLDKTFENYRVAEGNSQQASAKRKVQAFADNWLAMRQNGNNLILCGNPGTGKTHLAVALARQITEAYPNETVLMARFIELVRTVAETYGKGSETTERQALEQFTKPNLLIIDEFGHQRGTDNERMIMFEIINARYENVLPTVIITNLSTDELKEYACSRTIDRLRENGKACVFDWASQRGQKEANV